MNKNAYQDLYAEDPDLGSKISEVLKEKEKQLIQDVVNVMGGDFAIKLLENTLKTEADGGMVTKEGNRRTLGGVYLLYLRQRITPEQKKLIFNSSKRDRKKRHNERQKLIKAMRKFTTTDSEETEVGPTFSLWEQLTTSSNETKIFKLSPGILSRK